MNPTVCDVHYKAINKQFHVWSDANIFLPYPFDIVTVDLGDRTASAWWDGNEWDGFKLSKDDVVKRWKKIDVR